MHIGIIGAGFAGLATAWHLLNLKSSLKISIFDSTGVGGAASGIAAGLLHPFAGAHAKLNRLGWEGMASSLALIQQVEQELGCSLILQRGLLRVAITEAQQQDYALCAQKYPKDTKWIKEVISIYPYLSHHPGLFIESAVTINSPLYLQGLWQACSKRGVTLHLKKIEKLADLDVDQVIVTAGASTGQFAECQHLPINAIKGQILELQWPDTLPQLPIPLNSHIYMLMNEKGNCIAGSTFEREATHPNIDQATAEAEILPKVIELIPQFTHVKVLGCSVGHRVSTPDHLPLIARISRGWAFTGLGSKGLLYHSLYAEKLANRIVLL